MTAILRNRRFALVIVCCAALAALVAGCGGSGSAAGKGNVALVDGQPITKTKLDVLVGQYCDQLKASKQSCPKPGSSASESVIQTKIVPYLVQREEFEQQARKLHVAVTTKDVDAAEQKTIKQYFNGSKKKYLAAIKAQHTTRAAVRDNIGFSVLQNKVVAKLTGSLKVSNQEALKYYNQNKSNYSKPPSRNLRHILVKTKKLAQSIYDKLQNGADFAALAKKYSTDTGSKANGGKLGVQYETQLVADFAKVAFALKTGVISKPVKSQYGWHIIEALGPVVPKSVTSFSKAKASIVQQLLQAKKSDTMTAWQDRITKYYSTRVKYSSGYAPPKTAPTSTSSATTGITP